MSYHTTFRLITIILALTCGILLHGGILGRLQPTALAESANNGLNVDAWSRTGPRAGSVVALAVAPSSSTTIYIGIRTNVGGYSGTQNNGVYKSVDGGNTWGRAGLADKIIYSLAVDPVNPSIVYTGTYRYGIYKSTDGGGNWTKLSIPNTGIDGGDVTAIAIDQTSRNTIYTSVAGSGLYKSTDAGATWSSINNGIQYYGANALVIDPVLPNIVYAALGNGEVFKTTNGGQSWSKSSTGLPFGNASQLSIGQNNTSILFLVTSDSTTPKLYKSSDGGANWVLSDSGLPQRAIRSVVISPTNSSTVFAGTSEGLYKSIDGGASWVKADLDGLNVVQLAFDPSNPSNIYAGSRGLGVYRSVDGGNAWSQSSTGLPFSNVQKIVVNPLNPAIVYAGTNDGVVKSDDYGQTWGPTGLTGTLSIVYGLVIDPKNPSTLYAGVDFTGVYKSVDAGKTWTLQFPSNTNFVALAIDPSNPQTLYMALYDRSYKSTDGGKTWLQMSGVIQVFNFAIDPTNSSIIYAARGITLLKSTNGGFVWQSTSLQGNFINSIVAVAVDQYNPSIVYAGTTDNGAFKSTDGGLSWKSIFTDAPSKAFYSLSIDPVTPSVIYAGTDGGVFRSADGGATSTGFNANLPATATPIAALTIDPAGNHMYAATPEGVFTYQLRAASSPGQNPLSGSIRDINGNGIPDVTLTVSGAQNGQTVSAQTDAQGNYSFNNSTGGDTLTPSKAGYVFSPSAVRNVSSSGILPITGAYSFIGGTTIYTFSGQIIDGTGAGLSNALVTLSGSLQGSVMTDSTGNYSFSLFAGGNYTVTPSRSGYVFNPSRVTVNNLSANRSFIFVGTTHPYNISGQVKDAGNNPQSNVLVTLSRAGGAETLTFLTNSSGNYGFTNVAGEATYTVTPTKSGSTFSPPSATFSNPSGNQTANFTAVAAAAPLIQFSQASYNVSEAEPLGYATVMVERTGDFTSAASVNYTTSDSAGLAPCASVTGNASERCDYATTLGTLRWNAGEGGMKSFTIPIVNDALVEGNETFTITLSNPTGASLGTQTQSSVIIQDDDATASNQNPIDDPSFFIKQQYSDFLGRLPDPTGFKNWQDTLKPCPGGGFGLQNPDCDRVKVALSTFQSEEFQTRGYWAYRFYEVAFGRRPNYSEFIPDMAQVGGPKSPAEGEASKQQFIDAFVLRQEFIQKYGAITDTTQYIDALLQTAGLSNLTIRSQLISDLQAGRITRARALRQIVETKDVEDRFYNRGLVSMMYFGFMRRDPDTTGFSNYINNIEASGDWGGKVRQMVFDFIYSTEYRGRFGKP